MLGTSSIGFAQETPSTNTEPEEIERDQDGNWIMSPQAFADLWAYQTYLEHRVGDLKDDIKSFQDIAEQSVDTAEQTHTQNQLLWDRNDKLESKLARRHTTLSVIAYITATLAVGVTTGYIVGSQ